MTASRIVSSGELCHRTAAAQYLLLGMLGRVQVNLGGGDAAVSQKVLYIPDVHSLVQQHGGESMSEHVGCDFSLYACQLGVFGYYIPHCLGGDGLSQTGEEDGCWLIVVWRTTPPHLVNFALFLLCVAS